MEKVLRNFYSGISNAILATCRIEEIAQLRISVYQFRKMYFGNDKRDLQNRCARKMSRMLDAREEAVSGNFLSEGGRYSTKRFKNICLEGKKVLPLY